MNHPGSRMVVSLRLLGLLLACCFFSACEGDVAPAPLKPEVRAAAMDQASSQRLKVSGPGGLQDPIRQVLDPQGSPSVGSEQPPGEPFDGPFPVLVQATVEEGRTSRPAAGMSAVIQYSVTVAREKHAGQLIAVLDEEGQALFRIEPIPGFDLNVDRLTVVASLSEPGYCEGQKSFRWKPDRAQLTAKLVARPGATLHGRVVGVDGQPPVGSCSLALQGTSDPNRPSRLRPVRAYARGGEFALDLTHPGTFVLTAYSRPGGSQRISGLKLDPNDLPDDLVVQLEGPGVLAGQVLDPGGLPVPNLSLGLVHNDERGTRRGTGYDISSVLKAQAGGHRVASVTTDDQGRFEATGLAAGLFRIYDNEEQEQDLGGRAWPTGLMGIKLVVDAYVLSVSVEDAEGEPLEAAVSGRREIDRLWLHSCTVSGDAPRLKWILRDGVRIARTRPNVVYEISAWGGGYSRSHREVSLGPKNRREHVSLVLSPKLEPAELILQPLKPGGEALQGKVRARIYAGRNPDALARLEGQADTAMQASLPPGTYRVVVEKPDEMWDRFDLEHWREALAGDSDEEDVPALPAPSFGSVVHTLELRPGESLKHRPRLIGMGWLRVRAATQGPVGPATRVRVQARRKGPLEPSSHVDSSNWQNLSFPGAVDSRASENQAQSVRHSSHGSDDANEGLLPNLDQRAEWPLAVGTWQVRIECEGHVPVEVKAVVAQERESLVEVQLTSDG